MFSKIDDLADQVILFRPVYTSQGNITELFLKNDHPESCYDLRSIHTVRFTLARIYAVDLSAQAKMIKRSFYRSAPVPFYLPDGRVYVPLKMRDRSLHGDSIYGYIEIQAVKSLNEQAKNTFLELITGRRIPLFTSISTARAVLYLGHEIHKNCFEPEENEEAVVMNAVHILLTKLDRLEKHLEDL